MRLLANLIELQMLILGYETAILRYGIVICVHFLINGAELTLYNCLTLQPLLKLLCLVNLFVLRLIIEAHSLEMIQIVLGLRITTIRLLSQNVHWTPMSQVETLGLLLARFGCLRELDE